MQRLFSLLVMGVCTIAAGCVTHHHHPHGMPPGQAKKMLHVHGRNCGHIFVNGAWFESSADHMHTKKNTPGHRGKPSKR